MMKNDYRRSLIMLRVHAQGYSGHVRLERRTLMGNLYAVINVPDDGSVLCAALIRPEPRGGYTAMKLGELRRDGRGQASLAHSFDPRNIGGRPLEDYRLIVIVSGAPHGRCEAVLSGSVNGSCEVDWGAAQAAACAVCLRAEAPSCEARPHKPRTDGESPAVNESASPQQTPGADASGGASPEPPAGEPAFDLPPEPVDTVHEDSPVTAAETLGLDASVPWPGVAEQVRPYFAAQSASEHAPDDGYTYITAPMPEDSGFDAVQIGLRVRQGVPVAIAYALASQYSADPPGGLESYIWKGGATDGWWTIETDPYTGERLS